MGKVKFKKYLLEFSAGRPSGMARRGARTRGWSGAALFRVRIRAEHFHVTALLLQLGDGFGDLFVQLVTVAINEEVILPRFALAGARFDFGEVDAVTPERSQPMMERADLVGDADHQARAVPARGRTTLATEHEEARGVGGIVLDVPLQHAQAVFLGGEQAGQRRRALFPGGEFGGSRVRRGFDDLESTPGTGPAIAGARKVS